MLVAVNEHPAGVTNCAGTELETGDNDPHGMSHPADFEGKPAGEAVDVH